MTGRRVLPAVCASLLLLGACGGKVLSSGNEDAGGGPGDAGAEASSDASSPSNSDLCQRDCSYVVMMNLPCVGSMTTCVATCVDLAQQCEAAGQTSEFRAFLDCVDMETFACVSGTLVGTPFCGPPVCYIPFDAGSPPPRPDF